MNHHRWLKKKITVHDELAFKQSLLTYFSHYLMRTLQQEEKLIDLPDDSLQFLSHSHVPAFYNSNTISTHSHMNNCWSGNTSGCWGFNWGLCADWSQTGLFLLEPFGAKQNYLTNIWGLHHSGKGLIRNYVHPLDGVMQSTHAAC